MTFRQRLSIAAALLAALALAIPVQAQVPPHTPGTICFAPTFWCWAETPGPVGATCQCYSPETGWVWGTLG